MYLGIKYHWGDHFNKITPIYSELEIPQLDKSKYDAIEVNHMDKADEVYVPEIVVEDKSVLFVESMNKKQVIEFCKDLLSKTIKDEIQLELAVTNCVVSNYQDSYQNSFTVDEAEKRKKLRQIATKKCSSELNHIKTDSEIEKQLLMGICVSDELSR
jgi:predicted transcriptional regulator